VSGAVEPLAWDTEFFGVPIGRVDLDGATAEGLDHVHAEARDLGLACVYGSLDPVHLSTSALAQQRGWTLVDVATTFDLAVSEPAIPAPPGVETRVATAADREALAPLARGLAPWTRYAADPRFGLEAATRLQEAWLDRALAPSAPDHSAVLAEQDGEVIAFIGRVDDGRRRVDAVGTTRRGSGAARYLIEGARGWAGDVPLLGGPIMARNVAALRYVSHCSYRVCLVRYQLHLWLDR
jgi:hypothetical protein